MSTRRFSVTSTKQIKVEQSRSSNVKVVVRVRPPNTRELGTGKNNIIKVIDDYMLTFDPKEDYIFNIENKNRTSVVDKRIRDLQFAFDRVFHEKSTNNDIFEYTTKPVIDNLLDGYNCSVFAYGATSAGKTHTMLGSPERPGVIFLTMMELYKRLMKNQNIYDADISVSYLEIYNETCKDLLLPKGPLAVREDPEKGVCINGLSLHKPRSAEELLEMLHFGNQNRSQHPTDANQQSSRSHAIFQVFVQQCPKDSGLSANVKLAKMSLIDLAGSERATVTTNHGDRFREGANINKSLLALGNCINALAENKSNIHIPYRNSKLTRLLKDSLGGNCKTIMIAAISPSSLSYEDTYNTLKYADRAKSIKSALTSNILQVDYHVSQYGKIVEDLKAQVVSLQEKIRKLESTPSPQKLLDDEKYTDILKSYDHQIRSLFKEKELFKRQFIECEALEKESAMKLTDKEKSFHYMLQISNMFDHDSLEQSRKNLESFRSMHILKQSQLREQKTMLMSSLEENNKRILRYQNEIEQWANQANSAVRMQLNLVYDLCLQQLENVALKAQTKHMRKCFLLREAQNKRTERMLAFLMPNQNLAATSTALLHSLPGVTDISWADQTQVNKGETRAFADLADLTTGTPFKTPSNRSGVLRQVALSSKQFQHLPSNDSLTEHNITLKQDNAQTFSLNNSLLTDTYRSGNDQTLNLEKESQKLLNCCEQASASHRNPVNIIDETRFINQSKKHCDNSLNISMRTPLKSSYFNSANAPTSYLDPKQVQVGDMVLNAPVNGKTKCAAYNTFSYFKPRAFCEKKSSHTTKENFLPKSLIKTVDTLNEKSFFAVSAVERRSFRF